MFRKRLPLTMLLAAIFAGAATSAHGADPVDFARQILPILSNKCFVCHGPDGEAKDELRLDSYEGATEDHDGHRAIDPKTPAKSQILVRLSSTDEPMPPKKAEKQLTASERDLLTRWAREGGKYAKHWAFVPPKKHDPPGNGTATGSNAIDAFIVARLKEKGLDLAPEADRATLARRVALILTGLPPEPERLAAFLADKRPGAYERLVDQLLASSRYGEHQARYWLDAVRYGDTHGLHLDNRRGIYPYRDWVVHAMNKNLPLDDFITWQLAGDLLPNPSLEQRVATGFVRMNPTTAEGGVIPAEFQAKNSFDRTENLGTVLLGITLTCARCHSHKFDPIPQTEYYRLLAFFNSTSEGPLDGNRYGFGPTAKAPAVQTEWRKWGELRSKYDEAQAKAAAATKDSPAKAELTKKADELSKQLVALEKTFKASTLVARDLPKPRVTKLLQRGEYNLPTGEPLQPGILTVMGAFPKDAPRNRLGLAQWLTSREHPLVSRVLVNRIWQRVFGEGLVRTPEDFGLQGQQPTHPELLDRLAVELQDQKWDLKKMLRMMVTSRTFRQSSAWRKGIADPENRLLARGPSHRLDAEEIRDVALWSSGLLSDEQGGEGIKPFQPGGMWRELAHPASNTKQYVPDKGAKLFRRSLYVYWKRTSPHPMMTLFDAPSREASCVKRSRTNTSLQSLGLLNEIQRVEMARTLAQRLLHEAKDDTARLDRLFTLLACRKPTDVERAVCMKLLSTLQTRYREAPKDALALLSSGAAPRDEKLDAAQHAAWSQLAITVLASDVALLVY
jgi:cytochrome c553